MPEKSDFTPAELERLKRNYSAALDVIEQLGWYLHAEDDEECETAWELMLERLDDFRKCCDND